MTVYVLWDSFVLLLDHSRADRPDVQRRIHLFDATMPNLERLPNGKYTISTVATPYASADVVVQGPVESYETDM
jgi:hypothetical protein